MSDIVERLREVTSQTLTSECHQAADEIERLRKHHKIAVDGWTLEAQNVKQLEDEAHEMKAEIERLRADRDSWADQASERVKDCVEYLSKIERLKSLIKAKDLLLSEWLGEENESNPSSR